MAGSLVALVVSVATYDYLMGLLARYPTLGKVAVVLTGLLVLLALVHVVRELWAFRRLARIDGFRAEAAAVHASADRDAAVAFSERLAGFYGGRPELRGGSSGSPGSGRRCSMPTPSSR